MCGIWIQPRTQLDRLIGASDSASPNPRKRLGSHYKLYVFRIVRRCSYLGTHLEDPDYPFSKWNTSENARKKLPPHFRRTNGFTTGTRIFSSPVSSDVHGFYFVLSLHILCNTISNTVASLNSVYWRCEPCRTSSEYCHGLIQTCNWSVFIYHIISFAFFFTRFLTAYCLSNSVIHWQMHSHW